MIEFHQEVFPVLPGSENIPQGLLRFVPAKIRSIISSFSIEEKKEKVFSNLPTKEKVQEFKGVYKSAVIQLKNIVPAIEKKRQLDENDILEIEDEIIHFENLLNSENEAFDPSLINKIEYHIKQKKNELQLAKTSLNNTRDQGEALILTAQQLLQRAESTFKNINNAILSSQITKTVKDSINIGQSSTELSGQMLVHATEGTTNMVKELIEYASTSVIPQGHLTAIQTSMTDRAMNKEGAQEKINMSITTSLTVLNEIEASYIALEDSLFLKESEKKEEVLAE